MVVAAATACVLVHLWPSRDCHEAYIKIMAVKKTEAGGRIVDKRSEGQGDVC